MSNDNQKKASYVIDICQQKGVEDIVISPGSRSAPLVLACVHSKISSIVINDERSAGFYALGIAKRKKKPICLVCTSGTALLNYYPAIVEAFYMQIPIIVISADRPKSYISQYRGQTINQYQVFGNYVKYFTALENDIEEDEIYYNRTINTAINTAMSIPMGPTHINIPFTEEGLYVQNIDKVKKQRIIGYVQPQKLSLSASDENLFKQAFLSSKSVMCVIGTPIHTDITEVLKTLLQHENVVVLAEHTANISIIAKGYIQRPDVLFTQLHSSEQKLLLPDILITIGDIVVSKSIKTYFKTHKPKQHWRITMDNNTVDTYNTLTHTIVQDAQSFITMLADTKHTIHSTYRDAVHGLYEKRQNRHIDFFEQYKYEYTDFGVLQSILPHIHNANLHLANSTIIRYVQLLEMTNNTVRFFSNRGTAGIEGSMSTACGFAHADANTQNILMIGDISFLYDSNAMWSNTFPKNLKIIVINNSGGNIFNLLQEGKTEQHVLDTYFVSSPKTPVSLEHIAKQYNLSYMSISEIQQIPFVCKTFLETDTIILEIQIPAENNSKILKKYFKYISNQI